MAKKFKCLICGYDLDQEIIDSAFSNKSITCPKCNTNYEVCESDGDFSLKPVGWDS